MTTRNLDALFEPKAIALVGASNQPRSVGQVLAKNLFEGGFAGPVMAVNPHEQAVRSTINYHSVAELPVTPDLAVIATPPKTVPSLVAELGARGCRAAVVVTAGFAEGEGGAGHALQDEMLKAARPHLLRILGPNCIGFLSPGKGINASFVHLTPKAGELAFVTQSGAIASTVLDWATARGFGFSHVLSLGDMADIDFGDLLDYLAQDPATRAILLYVESIRDARKFMSAGRIAARAKPVIVIKSGRSAAGARAALSHTGALAGADHVYDAAFRRAGMLRVTELRELFEAVATLASGQTARGDRLAILTNGGGAGVLAADSLEALGGRLATLAPETIAALDTVLPATWSRANPVDIIGDANGERYGNALGAVLADPQSDAVLVMNCPTAVADSLDAARAVVEQLKGGGHMPAFTCWLGETAPEASRKLFAGNRIPTYETPTEAVRALMQLVAYRRNQDLLLEAPAGDADQPPPNRALARPVIARVLAEKRSVLTGPEAKEVLAAYGIPTAMSRSVADPAAAAAAAAEIGRPVALKILSPDISHKSDVGGVRLDLDTPAAVEAAAREMLAHVGQRMPDARITGFTVEEMVSRRGAIELLVGIASDATFGPVILFGQGGTAAELIGDRAVGLPPLNPVLAGEMIARTRIARLLGGYRDRPPVDIRAVEATLVKLSQMVIDLGEVTELDINPLIADAAGVLALDARIVVKPATGKATDRLAIKPYPSGLAHHVTLPSGLTALVRPIRPEDKGRLVELVARTAPDDIRLRFFGRLKSFESGMAGRLSQIDYSREMALVAVAPDPETGKDAILGVARFIADPNFETAEFAVLVRSDQKGRGLGHQLMSELIAYARAHGLKEIRGDVLRENSTMLAMAHELGFVQEDTEAPEVVRVTIDLGKVAPGPAASPAGAGAGGS